MVLRWFGMEHLCVECDSLRAIFGCEDISVVAFFEIGLEEAEVHFVVIDEQQAR